MALKVALRTGTMKNSTSEVEEKDGGKIIEIKVCQRESFKGNKVDGVGK